MVYVLVLSSQDRTSGCSTGVRQAPGDPFRPRSHIGNRLSHRRQPSKPGGGLLKKTATVGNQLRVVADAGFHMSRLAFKRRKETVIRVDLSTGSTPLAAHPKRAA